MLEISAEEIILVQKSKEPGYFFSMCPEEYYNSGYLYGQTIILRGHKSNYSGAAEFWLASLAWYSNGQNTLFEHKIFEDVSGPGYKEWISREVNLKSFTNKIKEANKAPKKFYLEKVLRQISGIKSENLVVMDTTWDDEKILFMDTECYYLYYFWTGE